MIVLLNYRCFHEIAEKGQPVRQGRVHLLSALRILGSINISAGVFFIDVEVVTGAAPQVPSGSRILTELFL